jgi:hypothetical protein
MVNALLEPAHRDPFAPPAVAVAAPLAPAPVAHPAKAPVPAPEPMAVPPPAPPPPPAVRYLGMVLGPTGQRVLLLGHGDQVLTLAPGLALPGGYVVQAREREGLRLVHGASGASHIVPIPAAADAGP